MLHANATLASHGLREPAALLTIDQRLRSVQLVLASEGQLYPKNAAMASMAGKERKVVRKTVSRATVSPDW